MGFAIQLRLHRPSQKSLKKNLRRFAAFLRRFGAVLRRFDFHEFSFFLSKSIPDHPST
jgi:hypothetical protein